MCAKLKEDTRFRALRLLHKHPEMPVRELAEAIRVAANSMHYMLNALIDKGLAELGNFTAAEAKRRYALVLTPRGIANKAVLTRAFLVRKMEEYEALSLEFKQHDGLASSSATS